MDVVCKVVDGLTGVVHAEFPVNLEHATWVPGGHNPAEASWTVHPKEPALAELRQEHLGGRVDREVQLWGDGTCRWWGVPLSYHLVSDSALRYTARDLKHHLLGRFAGPIGSNLLNPNADFEDGLTNWTLVGAAGAVSNEWRAKGTQSANLVTTSANQDSYLRRRVAITTTTDPVFLSLKALLHIASAGWVGPAFGERGLYAELQVTPGGPLVAGVTPVWEPLTNATLRDQDDGVWMETGITVPAGMTATVEVRLYSPGGSVWWDHTRLGAEESVGSALGGDPAEVVFTAIANYANAPSWGKSELNLPVTIIGPSLPALRRHLQFYANANILEALNQFVAEGLLEWDITFPGDGSARELVVWTAGRGAVIDPDSLKVEFPGNVVSHSNVGADGTGVATKVRYTGRGSKSAQDVFEAIDTSQMAGTTIEAVRSAPQDTATDGLYRLAAEDVAGHRAPVATSGFGLPAAMVFGGAWIGDTVTVEKNYGPAISGTETHRIGRLEWTQAGNVVEIDWEEAA